MIDYTKLTSLLKLEGQATEAPWSFQVGYNNMVTLRVAEVDAKLIIESRNILRELIQENLRLRTENDYLMDKIRYDIIKIN